MMSTRVLTILLTFFLTLPALANQLYVGNQPFEGRMESAGSDLKLSLQDLAEALKVEVLEQEGQWSIGGFAAPTETGNDGTTWIKLSDLPVEVVRVVRSKELGTIDLFRKGSVTKQEVGDWGLEGTLIYFYADNTPACDAMRPTMQTLEQSRVVRVKRLNVERPKSRVFQQYARMFDGKVIPYYLVLDKNDKKLSSFEGFFTYKEILEKLNEALAKRPDSRLQ